MLEKVYDKPILGFRKWEVDEVAGDLISVTANTHWKPGINKAKCSPPFATNKPCGDTPGNTCDCGFYAWFSFKNAEEYRCGHPQIIGAVAGAGKVRLHPLGFRSEEAQIIALYNPGDLVVPDYSVPVFRDRKEFFEYASSRNVVVAGNQESSGLGLRNGYFCSNGMQQWYENDYLHRSGDLPAVIRSDGTREWWRHGKLHRIEGPAIEFSNGRKEWWVQGRRHNLDGPAVLKKHWLLRHEEFWIEGRRVNNSDYKKLASLQKDSSIIFLEPDDDFRR